MTFRLVHAIYFDRFIGNSNRIILNNFVINRNFREIVSGKETSLTLFLPFKTPRANRRIREFCFESTIVRLRGRLIFLVNKFTRIRLT